MRIRQVLLIVVASLLGATGAAGQDLSNKVQIVYTLSTRPHLTATNIYSSPITGMAITMATAAAPQRPNEIIWYDSGIEFSHEAPLEPQQSYRFSVGPINLAPDLQPHLWAVTFQDGESFGDPHWLAELHARREGTYKEIGAVTTLLNQALAQHQSSAEIVSSLSDVKASLITGRTEVNMWARDAAIAVVQWAIANLQPPPGFGGQWGSAAERIPRVILPFLASWRNALERTDSHIIG